MDKTNLADQFVPPGTSADIGAFNALRFILDNNYAVQRRSNLDSTDWKDCTFKEVVKGIIKREFNQYGMFDSWSMKFYRVKPWISITHDEFVKVTDKIEFLTDKH